MARVILARAIDQLRDPCFIIFAREPSEEKERQTEATEGIACIATHLEQLGGALVVLLDPGSALKHQTPTRAGFAWFELAPTLEQARGLGHVDLDAFAVEKDLAERIAGEL